MFFGDTVVSTLSIPSVLKVTGISPTWWSPILRFLINRSKNFRPDRLKMSDNLPNYSDMIRLFLISITLELILRTLRFGMRETVIRLCCKGFITEWQYVDITIAMQYNNLTSGKYLFCNEASNESGFWNDQPKELIVILPAFYQTRKQIDLCVYSHRFDLSGLSHCRTGWVASNTKIQMEHARWAEPK